MRPPQNSMFWVVSISLITVSSVFAQTAPVCPRSTPINNTIELAALTSSEVTYSLENPITPATATGITAEWLTESELMSGATKARSFEPHPLPFTLGFCSPDSADSSKPSTAFFTGPDLKELATAQAVVVRFVPTEPGEITRYLRLSWQAGTEKKSKVYKVVGTSGVPDFAVDSRYKLWLYTGYTYLRTKNDFKDGFPEILARYETRLYDQRIHMKRHNPALYDAIVNQNCDSLQTVTTDTKTKTTSTITSNQCGKIPYFRVFRVYGETGLTGTAVQSGTDPKDPNKNQASSKVRQAFTGNVGLGYGWTLPVTIDKPGDTSAFTFMLPIARLGIITIPGVDDTDPTKVIPGRTAFNWSLGMRLENETGGNFEGTYFELGFGESEQFSQKKFSRLRFDGLIPLSTSNKLFRFAARLQVDTPRPFHEKENAQPGGELRISVLFNMDLKELSKRLTGQ